MMGVAGARGELQGSQPMSTAVHRSPNKLWRSISIFNLRDVGNCSTVFGQGPSGQIRSASERYFDSPWFGHTYTAICFKNLNFYLEFLTRVANTKPLYIKMSLIP